MTGKQLWDEIEALEREKDDLIGAASDDEIRRALGYGMNRPNSTETARNRVLLRRVLRQRGARIPDALLHARLSEL